MFNPIRGTQDFINNTPIVDGQFLFVIDQTEGKNNLYVDVGSNRIRIGAYDWSFILNKPFSTIGNGLNVNQDNELEVDISWSDVTNKPFISIGNGLLVNQNDELEVDISWSDVTNKPFTTIGDRLTVTTINGEEILSADIQTWGQIDNKPFTSIGQNLSVDNNGVLSANNQTWTQITNKPFTSIGTGLEVLNGVLVATGGGTGVDWATEVANKPFETLGSSFTVNSAGVLNLSNINWNVISNKPFTSIGSGLTVDTNNALKTNIAWADIISKPFTSIGSGLDVINNILVADVTWSDIINKPFTSIGDGLTVDTVTNTISADVQTVTASITGTASSSVVCKQSLVVTGNAAVNTPIDGTVYMEYTQNIIVGATDYVFTNTSFINTNSIIDVYTSEWGVVPSSVVIDGTNHTCTVTFVSSVAVNNLTCRIYIK